jgi:hypothetical protein
MERPPLHVLSNYLFLTACGLFLIGLYSCKKEEDKIPIKYTGPIETVQNVRVLYSENALLQVEMTTPLQYRYANDYKVFPDSVYIKFYDPLGTSVVTTLRADSGRHDALQNIYTVKGHVKIINLVENQRLYTTELIWNPAIKKVYTEAEVLVENTLTGERTRALGGMTSNQNFTNVTLKRTSAVFSMPLLGNP